MHSLAEIKAINATLFSFYNEVIVKWKSQCYQDETLLDDNQKIAVLKLRYTNFLENDCNSNAREIVRNLICCLVILQLRYLFSKEKLIDYETNEKLNISDLLPNAIVRSCQFFYKFCTYAHLIELYGIYESLKNKGAFNFSKISFLKLFTTVEYTRFLHIISPEKPRKTSKEAKKSMITPQKKKPLVTPELHKNITYDDIDDDEDLDILTNIGKSFSQFLNGILPKKGIDLPVFEVLPDEPGGHYEDAPTKSNDDSHSDLEDYKKELDDNKKELEDYKKDLDNHKKELEDHKKELEQFKYDIKEDRNKLKDELKDLQKEIDDTKAEIDAT